MGLSKLQQEIINSPFDKIVVLSSAASGKTFTMTEKVRQILRAGTNPRDIAVITFTNMAANELRQRLGADYKDGIFIGTIHALANYMLMSSGFNTGDLLDHEKFDELFELVQQHPQCIKHLDWVLLDEGQDSDELQFNFLFDLINPTHFFICADPKQSIYQWKGSNPNLIMTLAQGSDVHVFDMNENYRNGSNILNYAKRLISPNGMRDTSIAMRNIRGTITEIPFSFDAILSKVQEFNDYRNTAILARTNKEIQDISIFLSNHHIPIETFRQGDLTKDELTQKMENNTVKILTVHSGKGLEWDHVIVTGMRYTTGEERNICYVAATRARDDLVWMMPARRKKTTQLTKW